VETNGSWEDWAERRAELRSRMREGLQARGFELRPKCVAAHARWPFVAVWWGLSTSRYDDGAIQDVHLWARVGYVEEGLPQHWSDDPFLSSRHLDRDEDWQRLFEHIGREAVKKEGWAEQDAANKSNKAALQQIVDRAEKRVKTGSRIGIYPNEIIATVYLPHEEAALVRVLRTLKKLGVLREALA